MGLSKSKKGKSTFEAPKGNKKSEGFGNIIEAGVRTGLMTKKKGTPAGVEIKKKDVVPGMANMFLKIPYVKPEDLKGVPPAVLADWIADTPEMKDFKSNKGGGGGGGGGGSGTYTPPAMPPRNVKGPGWISITWLLGRKRA